MSINNNDKMIQDPILQLKVSIRMRNNFFEIIDNLGKSSQKSSAALFQSIAKGVLFRSSILFVL
jgi:hypothetical protein